MQTKIATITKTKTIVAIALTIISVGSMLAGIYHYGTRKIKIKKNNVTKIQEQKVVIQEKQLTNNKDQAVTEEKNKELSVIQADVDCQYQNASFFGHAEKSGSTINAQVKGSGKITVTGINVSGGGTSREVDVTCDSGLVDITNSAKVVTCHNSTFALSQDQLGLYVYPYNNTIKLSPHFGGKDVCTDTETMK